MLFRYSAGPQTLFKGLHALLPGHLLILKGRQIQLKRYWSPEAASPEKEIPASEVPERFETLMHDAVKRQIMSDVHSPSEFRVNGVVSNMPEFYAAFGVKPGDAMWREESMRVKIW